LREAQEEMNRLNATKVVQQENERIEKERKAKEKQLRDEELRVHKETDETNTRIAVLQRVRSNTDIPSQKPEPARPTPARPKSVPNDDHLLQQESRVRKEKREIERRSRLEQESKILEQRITQADTVPAKPKEKKVKELPEDDVQKNSELAQARQVKTLAEKYQSFDHSGLASLVANRTGRNYKVLERMSRGELVALIARHEMMVTTRSES